MTFVRRSLEIEDPELTRALLGEADCHLRRIRQALDLEIAVRRGRLHLHGSEGAVDKCTRAFQEMLRLLRDGQSLGADDVEEVLAALNVEDENVEGAERHARGEMRHGAPVHPWRHRPTEAEGWSAPHRKAAGRGHRDDQMLAGRVRPLTPGQALYMEAMQKYDLVFSTGPAGSGKTYLAVAMAVESLARNATHRLILVRPAVEAGEHLGFLPGDLREKVNPYLRPLYDALHDLLNPNQVARLMERGVIEVAPLAFMRGRTLNAAFVILDEAQNTTHKQMKMFLTRLGHNARAVVTGDITQVDLPTGMDSGLIHAREVLRNVEGVAFVELQRQDIVRHPLVQRIVNAYEENEAAEQNSRPAAPPSTP